MTTFSFLPKRQKWLLGAALVIGLLIIVYSQYNPSVGINNFITLYGIGLPFLLFMSPCIMDLDTNKIFLTWLGLASVLLLITIYTSQSQNFIIIRSYKYNEASGFNRYISNHSTNTLKALFFFLLMYWLLNTMLKKLTGNYVISTYRQSKWFSNDAKRKITGLDVLINIILLLTIIISALLGY